MEIKARELTEPTVSQIQNFNFKNLQQIKCKCPYQQVFFPGLQ